MTEGIVVGGWKFVWAAYGLTAAMLLGYAVSLAVRLRSSRRTHERN